MAQCWVRVGQCRLLPGEKALYFEIVFINSFHQDSYAVNALWIFVIVSPCVC